MNATHFGDLSARELGKLSTRRKDPSSRVYAGSHTAARSRLQAARAAGSPTYARMGVDKKESEAGVHHLGSSKLTLIRSRAQGLLSRAARQDRDRDAAAKKHAEGQDVLKDRSETSSAWRWAYNASRRDEDHKNGKDPDDESKRHRRREELSRPRREALAG